METLDHQKFRCRYALRIEGGLTFERGGSLKSETDAICLRLSGLIDSKFAVGAEVARLQQLAEAVELGSGEGTSLLKYSAAICAGTGAGHNIMPGPALEDSDVLNVTPVGLQRKFNEFGVCQLEPHLKEGREQNQEYQPELVRLGNANHRS